MGGLCMILGGVLAFIPFLLGIMAGRTPDKGIYIYNYFPQNIIIDGKESLAYYLLSVIALALSSFGLYTWNKMMQELVGRKMIDS
ncbi:MAG: hypothetical protein CMG74_03820 [Candidatus Marinimicrobia bacterium]|nr:hypothetical protein [Candidatus Neomarinimicrobiota bacterium]|tara:strand:+ start:552 stop:806 length:255 start_codon:yes stop_codon:yes gene_type:complete